jgi:hypothetical protein
MPVEPELERLLTESADRAVDAVNSLRRGMVSREEFDELKTRVDALVQPTKGKDGKVVYIARRTRLSIASVATLMTAFGAVFTPIIVVLLNR